MNTRALGRIGIGVLLVTVLVATVVATETRPTVDDIAFGTAALALAAFAAVPDAALFPS